MARTDTDRGRGSVLLVLILFLMLLAAAGWILPMAVRSIPRWVIAIGLSATLVLGITALMSRVRRRRQLPPPATPAPTETLRMFPDQRETAAPTVAAFSDRLHPLSDELTGLPGRIWFSESLKSELYRSGRYHHPLSLVVLEIDGFSKVITRHGQATGDYLIMTLARILRAAVRQSDLIARTGDASFAILVPETDTAGAVHVAEKLRRAVELYPFDENLAITASAAVTATTESDNELSILTRAEEIIDTIRRKGGNAVGRMPDDQ